MSEYVGALVVASVIVLILSLGVLYLVVVTQRELSEIAARVGENIDSRV